MDSFKYDVAITVCSDGSYCCGYQNYDCCDNEQGYRIVNGIVTPDGSNGTSSSAPSKPISSLTRTPSLSIASTASIYVVPTGISTAPNISTPTIISCSDPSWEPNPRTWADADVDSQLASWWSSTASERGSRTFVDWISSSFGDDSRGQHCGIGTSSSCSAPDCQSKAF